MWVQITPLALTAVGNFFGPAADYSLGIPRSVRSLWWRYGLRLAAENDGSGVDGSAA